MGISWIFVRVRSQFQEFRSRKFGNIGYLAIFFSVGISLFYLGNTSLGFRIATAIWGFGGRC